MNGPAAAADAVLSQLCLAAALIDQAADEVTAGVANLSPTDQRVAAAFAVADPAMLAWHAIKLVAIHLPGCSAAAHLGATALLDPGRDISFSIARLREIASLCQGGA